MKTPVKNVRSRMEMADVQTATLSFEALDWVIAACKRVPVEIMTSEMRCPADELLAMGHSEEQIAFLHSSPTRLFSLDVRDRKQLNYSSNWTLGGPIIDAEIDAWQKQGNQVFAHRFKRVGDVSNASASGPTTLIAGMRAYACATYGSKVKVPKLIMDALHRSEAQALKKSVDTKSSNDLDGLISLADSRDERSEQRAPAP
jgi:Protein of unknown function (DUF2591)